MFWLKNNLQNIFYVLLSVGFIVVSMFPVVFHKESTFFTIPFRALVLLFSIIIIIENIYKKRISLKKEIIVFSFFWFLYLAKAIYSLSHYDLPIEIISKKYEIIQRIFLIGYIPSLAVLINGKYKLNYIRIFKYIFSILFIVLFINVAVGIEPDRFGRSSGLHSIYSISFGHIGVSLVLLSAYYLMFIKSESRFRILSLLGILIGLYVLYASSTRSPFLALLICSVILFLLKKNYKLIISGAILFLVGIGLLYSIHPKEIQGQNSFFPRLYNAIFEGDTSLRGELYNKAINNFLENPILGKSILFSDGSYAHNIYLETLMATGIVGFIALLILHFFVLKKVFLFKNTAYNKDKVWILILFIQYFVLSLTSYNVYNSPDVWYYLSMLLAINLKNYEET